MSSPLAKGDKLGLRFSSHPVEANQSMSLVMAPYSGPAVLLEMYSPLFRPKNVY